MLPYLFLILAQKGISTAQPGCSTADLFLISISQSWQAWLGLKKYREKRN